MNYLNNYLNDLSSKKYVKKAEHIPVFLHIPKCAGTFTLGILGELLRLYSYLVFRKVPKANLITFELLFQKNSHACAAGLTAYAVDANKNQRTYAEKNNCRIDFDDFLKLLETGDVEIFCLAVTSKLLSNDAQDKLFLLQEASTKPFVYFMHLRSVYSRCLSMYNVHKAVGTIRLKTLTLPRDEASLEEFSTYLISYDSEPEWLHIFISYIFPALAPSKIPEFSKSYITAGAFYDARKTIKEVFSSVYGKVLGDFVDYIPDEMVLGNKGISLANYRPSELSTEVVEKYKRLHEKDIHLIKTLLPNATFDSLDVDILKEP